MCIQRLHAFKVSLFIFLCVLFTHTIQAQTKTITGKVTDDKGVPVLGATVTAKGTKVGASTDATGTFHITMPANSSTLVISSVGFTQQEIRITDQTMLNVALVVSQSNLNEVVVIGYGTARKKELTGAYSVVSAKDFNRVPSATPDQLLQGKVAGLEITVASGQPGGLVQVKIRGNNSIRAGTDPLYVVDGVPLDGRSARPNFTNVSGLGATPDGNPLTYLNPADIESMTILKDAAASAIYGSRGANGVILITTRTGSSGPTKVDAYAAIGTNGLMRHPDVLDPGQYRTALAKYGAKSDSGASLNPFNQIVQHKVTQNYSVALSGGTDNSKYRASFLASTTPGLIRKSALTKYVANVNGSFKLLDKRLTIGFGLTMGNTVEQIAPVSNNAGSTGNIISNAMQWNPTLLMKHGDLNYVINPNGQVNPLSFSDAYNDHAYTTTLLGYVSAAVKITDDLEYKFLYGANYGTGQRGAELQGWISGTGGNADGQGEAIVGATQLFSETLTHLLTYTHKWNDLAFTAVAGYEYYTTHYKTQFTSVYGFDYNLHLNSLIPVHYYDNMQDGKQANLSTSSSNDPAVDLQSYFGRVQFVYKDKYTLYASLRSDGSNKFGSNNKYGYFPAVSARWSINDEDFLKDNRVFSSLALRAAWGESGNQSFPAGAALERYQYSSNGNQSVVNFPNASLKWETVSSKDVGVDFGFFGGRLTGIIDWFDKKTTDVLYAATYPLPAPSGVYWTNLNGHVSNKGVEFSLNAVIIKKQDFSWTLGGNVTYVKNLFVYPPAGTAPLVLTGQLNGKGTSATYVQAIANNQPIDVFYLRKFHGFDQNGFAMTDLAASYQGDPNPKYSVGLYTSLDYKKFNLSINMHGNYDFSIYNNTLQSVTGLSFINIGSNIAKTLIGTPENPANPVSASTRYMYSGDYMKLGNASISYHLSDHGKLKNATIILSGANLFVISKYPGFDPEVNVSTADQNGTGIPSRGIDYVGYPTNRSVTLGLNFSLN